MEHAPLPFPGSPPAPAPLEGWWEGYRGELPARPLPWPEQRTSVLTVYRAMVGLVGAVTGFVIEAALSDLYPSESAIPQERLFIWLQLALVLLASVRSIVGWFVRTYELALDEARFAQGIVAREVKVVPYSRLQQVSIRQTLLDQIFRVSRVRIDTAGSSAGSVELAVLRRGDAELLRRTLLERQAAVVAGSAASSSATASMPAAATASVLPVLDPSAGPTPTGVVGARTWAAPTTQHGWPGEQAPAGALLELAPGELMLAGLLNNPLLLVAAALVVADLTAVGVAAAAGAGTEVVGGIAAGLIALVPLALLAVVAPFGMAISQHGYRLSAIGDDLHLRYGLFQISELTFPRRRVQWVSISQQPLQRLARRCSVVVHTAAPSVTSQRAPSTRLSIPSVRRDRVVDLLREVMADPGWELPAIRPRPQAARRRAILRRTMPFALPILVTAIFEPAALVALPVSALGWWWGVVAHRRAGSGETARVVALAKGAFVNETRVVARARVQSTRLSRSPLQRLAGLSTLSLDVAGGSAPTLGDLGQDEAAAFAAALGR